MSPVNPPSDDAFAAKVHADATALCGEIMGFFQGRQMDINEIIFVPMIIFARIIRLRDAALTLTKARFPTEAGIIVLSQFEAKLDLVQAARDVKWAARWVGHQNTLHSLTNIKTAIDMTFGDEKERAAERSTFRHLSALKHGNPASSELGFQVRRTERVITLSTGEVEDAMTDAASAMMAGYATYQLAWAAQALQVTTGQYAICDPAVERAVRANWQDVSGFGKDFALFLASLVEGRAGHVDIAAGRQR